MSEPSASPSAPRPLLDVTVTHARDLAGCVAGGADRLFVVAAGDAHAVSPEPALVSAAVRSGLPVRALLRSEGGAGPWAADEGALARLAGLGGEYAALGVEGVVLGFLDHDLEVDEAACRALLGALPALPWTFGRAIDHALDTDRSWGRVVALPGVDAVRSGGSPRGLEQGHDDLLALVRRSPQVARLVLPAGGLVAEQVPWFRRAGVDRFHVGTQVRPGATWRSYVDADYVRSWRLLLDGGAGR